MIRSATHDDAVGLAELLQTLGDDLPRLRWEPLEAALARIESTLEARTDHTLLVADLEAQIAGFCHTVWQPSVLRLGGEGFITALFLRPAFRGRGLGRALLGAIRAEAEGRGCSRLSLLNMRDRASYARAFYAKQGWTERPEAANFVLELSREA